MQVYYKRIYVCHHLELSTGVFINGGGTMDRIKDLEQTANPFEGAVMTLKLSTDLLVGSFVVKSV
jgi:hypothetical protein